AHRFEPIPTADAIRRAGDERLVEELTGDGDSPPIDERTSRLAERLAGAGNVEPTLARLLVRGRHAGGVEPREVRFIAPPSPPEPRSRARGRPAETRPETEDRPRAAGRGAPRTG